MKVLLIRPPSPYLDNDASYPPSGLMYLAAAIERGGHEAMICDMTGNTPLAGRAVDDADLIGISCVTPDYSTVMGLISRMDGKTIIVGGPHPSFCPDDFIPDAVPVIGHAESTILNIIDDLKKESLGRWYHSNSCTMEEIPLPARHLVDLKRYSPGGWSGSTAIYTSRGCPFSCRFCSKLEHGFSEFTVQRVLQEVRQCMDLGIKRFVFGDDNIIRRRQLIDLLNALEPLDIQFRLNQDSRKIDGRLLDAARDAGCIEVSYGIESGSQRMLDLMNKRNTVENNGEAIRATKKAGLTAKAYFMVNFPGETKETIMETLDFAEEARPDKWLISAFSPLPGSHIFENPARYGIDWMSDNWDDYYLIGKGGSFKPCFEARGLSIEQQVENFHLMYDGLKERLG